MRRSPVLYVMAALLVASVALAAKPQTGTATISALAASGISGTADIKFDQQTGLARIHEAVSGLTPGVQYESLVFTASTTCGSGGSSAVLMTFTANASGRANFNVIAPPQVGPLTGSASISVQQVSDNALVACGEIVVQ